MTENEYILRNEVQYLREEIRRMHQQFDLEHRRILSQNRALMEHIAKFSSPAPILIDKETFEKYSALNRRSSDGATDNKEPK